MDISELLDRFQNDIIDTAVNAMERTHLQHYERDGADRTRTRVSTLFSLAKKSVKEKNLSAMVSHAEQIATERYNAGYDLWEVQTAFNVLEETIWVSIFKNCPSTELANALGLISTVLGAGKDTLARKYVSLATKAKAPSLNLQSLFSGSE
jgi:hypothetical protein